MAPRRPKMAQDGSKMAQDGSKMAQDGPKMVQDGPKMAQTGSKMAHKWPQDVSSERGMKNKLSTTDVSGGVFL